MLARTRLKTDAIEGAENRAPPIADNGSWQKRKPA